jgi:hypothetical protein
VAAFDFGKICELMVMRPSRKGHARNDCRASYQKTAGDVPMPAEQGVDKR